MRVIITIKLHLQQLASHLKPEALHRLSTPERSHPRALRQHCLEVALTRTTCTMRGGGLRVIDSVITHLGIGEEN